MSCLYLNLVLHIRCLSIAAVIHCNHITLVFFSTVSWLTVVKTFTLFVCSSNLETK